MPLQSCIEKLRRIHPRHTVEEHQLAERKTGSYPGQRAKVCHQGAGTPQELDDLMASREVGEVWGVGPKIGAHLQAAAVKTVLDLKWMDLAMVS